MASPVWKPHTTVASICERDGLFLLVKEKVKGKIVFNQPAGHLEKNETLITAVIRETLEETRYAFTPTGLLGIYRLVIDPSTGQTYIRLLFTGDVGEKQEGELDEDIISAEWMSYEEIESCQNQHRSPMVLQCIDDYLSKKPYSLDLLDHSFA